MKRTIAALMVAGMLAAVPAESQAARIFDVWGKAKTGYLGGSGKDAVDFFDWAGGGFIGVEVGAKLLFISAFIEYMRTFGGDTGAHLVGFNLGGDGDITLSGGLSLTLRGSAAVYLGSLDSATRTSGETTSFVNTTGVGGRAGIGLKYTFVKILSIGVLPQGGVHYFFTGAKDKQPDQNSFGWDFRVMAFFRIGLGV